MREYMIRCVEEGGTMPIKIEEVQGERYKNHIRKMKDNKKV